MLIFSFVVFMFADEEEEEEKEEKKKKAAAEKKSLWPIFNCLFSTF